MERQKSEKLRELLDLVPHGYLVDAKTLGTYGIDNRLAHKYVKSRWLESVVHGLYRRPFISSGYDSDKPTDWRMTVLSMMLMNYEVHVGGSTALGLEGYSHYLPLGEQSPVFLYGDDMPGWLHRLPEADAYSLRSLKLFDTSDMLVVDSDTKFAGDTNTAINPYAFTMRVSAPERAILEMLNELPKHESFHQVDMLFQSLTTLSPQRLQSLLADCRSVKAKRLFFVFADRHNHAWRKYLSSRDFDLGAGSRALVKGGKYHPVYNISVPEEFVRDLKVETQDGP